MKVSLAGWKPVPPRSPGRHPPGTSKSSTSSSAVPHHRGTPHQTGCSVAHRTSGQSYPQAGNQTSGPAQPAVRLPPEGRCSRRRWRRPGRHPVRSLRRQRRSARQERRSARQDRYGRTPDKSAARMEPILTAYMDVRRFMTIKAVEEQAIGTWNIGNRGHAIRLQLCQENARCVPQYI
jgi:hypothetical protein